VDYAEALRGFFGNAQPDPGYAGPLRQMIDPLAGKRSVGEMPSTQYAVKEVGKGIAEPFGQLGRVMTGRSEDTLIDIVGAAAGLAPIGPPGVGKLLKPAAEAAESAIARGAAKGAKAIASDTGGLNDFIKAYHGSPHDFDRFDISKIGTGEGAQAYGHGLYFAENEGVAKGYKEALTRNSGAVQVLTPFRDGILDNSPRIHERYFAARLKENKGDLPAAIKQMQGDLERMPGDKTIQEAVDFAKSPNAKFSVLDQNPGRMYQVAIKAPPEHFLDWNKPLSEQSEHVKSALENHADPYVKSFATKNPSHTGEQTYRYIGSDILREGGIPGIKYLDQGSRGKGEGSRNYVVFDDKLIDILKKYGIAGIGALPAMNAFHYQDKRS
jgi:hypothetical protein